MHGEVEGVIPGNALIVDPNKPFRKLNPFGNTFLNRWEEFIYSQCCVMVPLREPDADEIDGTMWERECREEEIAERFLVHRNFKSLCQISERGGPFLICGKNGERERYRPRQWWKLMYSDRICSVRKFKVEVRGLHGPSGQRQTSEVTDIVGLRGPVRETFKFFPPLCLLSGLPDFCVRFSTDVNQERSQMFYNKVLLAAGNVDTQPRRDRNWQYHCSWGSDVKFLVPIFQQSPSAGCVRERSCVSPLASTSCSRNRWAR